MRDRQILKSFWKELGNIETDRKKNIPKPPVQENIPEGSVMVKLPEETAAGSVSFREIAENRRSVRKFSPGHITLEELSYLLRMTQGVRAYRSGVSYRTVPSGGSRHPFETYLFIKRVESLDAGLYRYLPLSHELCFLSEIDRMDERLDEALLRHDFHSAVTFVWAAVPYRTEWAYSDESYKLILLDAGHVCQNLYLAAESIGCGTCAVGAYDQEAVDNLCGLDGKDIFTVYAAPVGRKVQ